MSGRVIVKWVLLAGMVVLVAACDPVPQPEGPEAGGPAKPSLPTLPKSQPPHQNVGREIPLDNYRKATITVSGHRVSVFVADDERKMSEGLMFVQPGVLRPDEGMIFVYPDEDFRFFWMKNTPQNLDIAFLTSDGTIINILTMKAFSEASYSSDRPARYALEMQAGWFQSHSVEAGAKVDVSNLRATAQP